MRLRLAASSFAMLTLLALPVAHAQPKDAATPAADKLICKRQVETGSLVRAQKRCFTRANWERIAESQQRGARKMVEQLAGACGNAETGC